MPAINVNNFVSFAAAMNLNMDDYAKFCDDQLQNERNNNNQILDTTQHTNHLDYSAGTYHSDYAQKPDDTFADRNTDGQHSDNVKDIQKQVPTLHTDTYAQGTLSEGMEHVDQNGEHSQHIDGWAHTNAGAATGEHWDISHTNTDHFDCLGHLDQYTQHINNSHTNNGFDHQNYIPSTPVLYDMAPGKQVGGMTAIAIFSYDRNNDGQGTQDVQSKTIKYDMSIRKVANPDNSPDVSDWVDLLKNSDETVYQLNTVDPLKRGVTELTVQEGFYEIQVTAKNSPVIKNGVSKTYNSQIQTYRIKIQQNTSPEISVQNGSEFVNFYFGDLGKGNMQSPFKTYDEGYADAPSDKREGLLVVVNMKDVDTAYTSWDNWQKGMICLQNPDGTPYSDFTADIIWEESGTNIISSANAIKKGYAFIPKADIIKVPSLNGIKVVASVQDFMDAGCTTPAGNAVVRNTISSADFTNLVINIDTVAPAGNAMVIPSGWSNFGAGIMMSGSDADGSGVGRILMPDGQTWITGSSAAYGVTLNGTYNFLLEDNAGNQTEVPVIVDKIEKIAPTMMVSPESADVVDIKIPVDVSVYDEGGSEVKEFRYAWSATSDKSDSGWNDVYGSSGEIYLTQTGSWYLQIEAFDNAGNSTYHCYGVYTLTAPVINIDYRITAEDHVFADSNTIPAGEGVILESSGQGETDGSGGIEGIEGIIVTSNTPISSTGVYVVNNGQEVKIGDTTLGHPDIDGRNYTYYYDVYNFNLPENLVDGEHTIFIRSNAQIGIDKTVSEDFSVYTPVWEDYYDGQLKPIPDPLHDVAEAIIPSQTTAFEKQSTIQFLTSKYTGKVKIKIDGITFYALRDGKFGENEDGSDESETLVVDRQDLKYRVSGLTVQTNGYDYRWSFDFAPVNNYPLIEGESYIMEFTAYDTAGNWDITDYKHQTNPQPKTINAFVVELFDFKITDIRDRKFQYLFNGTGRVFTVPQLPVDRTDQRDGLLMKLGYAFYFEISSKGMGRIDDAIRVRPEFYSADTGEPLDMYYATEDQPYVLATSDYMRRSADDTVRIYYEKEMTNLLGFHNELYIPTALRTISGDSQIWKGRYGVPATAIFVRKGEDPEIPSNRIKSPVIINFEIDAFKNGAQQFDYIEKDQWKKERLNEAGNPAYPYKYNNYKEGDVILIDPSHSILDDYEATPTH